MCSGRGAAAAADDVDEAARANSRRISRGLAGVSSYSPKAFGKAGVRVDADIGVGDARQLLDVRPHQPAPSAQLRPTNSGSRVADRVPEGLDRLARSMRPEASVMVPETISGSVTPLSSNSVSAREDAPPWHSACRRWSRPAADRRRPRAGRALLRVGADQFVEGHVARKPGSLTSGEMRGRAVGRPERAGDETRRCRCAARTRPPTPRARRAGAIVQLRHQACHAVVGLRDGGGVEGVGLDDVGAGLQIGAVDPRDDLRLRERQQVVVALEVAGQWSRKRAPRKSASSRLYRWIIVPMAPSSSRMRSPSSARRRSIRVRAPSHRAARSRRAQPTPAPRRSPGRDRHAAPRRRERRNS